MIKPLVVALALTVSLTLAPVAGIVDAESDDGPHVGDVDHVGLTVTDLDRTTTFFIEVLGFKLLKRDDEYPATFLSNGEVMITLWRATDPATATPFNRKTNVGLHHLALQVDSFEALDAMHERVRRADGVRIEFAPEPLSGGPAKHMMFREPSGNRLELIHRPPSP
ncbi:MAG: VOC family protein [Myxococcales bacterium]|jgi:lactoylglutathione lyase|nr:MAG: VOC family protein [Myxococcales bacterium]